MSSDFGKQSIKNRRERYAVRGNDRASPLGFSIFAAGASKKKETRESVSLFFGGATRI